MNGLVTLIYLPKPVATTVTVMTPPIVSSIYLPGKSQLVRQHARTDGNMWFGASAVGLADEETIGERGIG